MYQQLNKYVAETVSDENIIGPSAVVLCAYGIRKL